MGTWTIDAPFTFSAPTLLAGAFAQVDVGLDQPPGEYTLTVTVKDPTSGRMETLKRPFTVLAKAFTVVRLTYTNFALFLPLAGLRTVQRWRGLKPEDHAERDADVETHF